MRFNLQIFFCLQRIKFCVVWVATLGLTHTVTHTAKCPEKDREWQTGSFTFRPGFFAAFSALHNLCHKISHRLRSPVLLLPGGVGVGAEGKAGIIVPQYTDDSFDIHPVLES